VYIALKLAIVNFNADSALEKYLLSLTSVPDAMIPRNTDDIIYNPRLVRIMTMKTT
jgi:hypothetical protein